MRCAYLTLKQDNQGYVMIKRIIYLGTLALLLLSSWAYAKQGPLFKITESGNPAAADVILCLNGKGPLSCQRYHVSAQDLHIRSTANHYYPIAGIMPVTPGYRASGCTLYPKTGYCLFATSNTTSATIHLSADSQKTVPGAPANVTATAGNAQASVSWTAPSNGGSPITNYTVTSHPAGGTCVVTGTTANCTGLTNGTSYIFAVYATNAIGNGPAANSNPVTPSSPIQVTIATGAYSDGSIGRLLLALSKDAGTTWAFPESITAPLFTPNNTYPFNVGFFNGASCTGNTCIAVGGYSDGSTSRPLLALSKDAGTTWTFPEAITAPLFTPNNPDPFNFGFFNGTSCTGNTCVAVGTYNGSTSRPLLALSKDAGTIWTFPASITAPVFTPNNAHPFNAGSFNSASCTNNTCVAVGSYADANFIGRPLLALSKNAGTTWAYPDSITAPLFTPNNTHPFNNGLFNSTSCTGNTCIAVGSYNDGSIDRPLLALSKDAGTTWTFPEAITAPVFTPNNTHPFNNGFFNGASCTGNTCIAVGAYHDGSTGRPLLALSKNAGTTWTFPASITAPVFTPNNAHPFNTGSFNGASCAGNTCIAVGAYHDGSTPRPFLALSKDAGTTWTFPETITAPVFTPNNTHPFNNGSFSRASCAGNTCIAVGTYDDDNFTGRPLLALSKDAGTTWTYPEAITAPVFTPNNIYPFNSGYFNGATGFNSLLYPKSLHFLSERSAAKLP
ncbi:fibronectin type III domain-containing protein [Legionella bozemanae]|uniref:fibronectin type III domain-containing protein n=1 Tax=Legionella bozemanae TaxID=447 RepID=UPI003EEC2144